jgi:hypothetical protein
MQVFMVNMAQIVLAGPEDIGVPGISAFVFLSPGIRR